MATQPALVLIGPMAAGKSRTGRRVAKRLGLDFRDTDSMIESIHGPIREIFAERGEAAFRELEREQVRRALESGGVIAFGGGAVLHPDTQAEIASSAVVYLQTTPEAVAPRLEGDSQRPLVATDGLARWTEIYEARKPIYERLGKLHIDTSHRPMDAVADEIAAWYRSRFGTGE